MAVAEVRLASEVVYWIGLFGIGAIITLLLADVGLIAVHIRRGARQMSDERALMAEGIEGMPSVCIQLPVFNEATLVGPAIDSLCALDWQRERLQIQVLDDSTDQTSEIIADRITRWRSRGVSIEHLQREGRTDYKAGALSVAMAYTAAPYIAVFDADYRPAASFLKQMMPALIADRRLAFVQARINYRNRAVNWLTRAQALELDMLQAYEQAARNWSGVPTTFSGTCGIWRRSAIIDAGGWSGSTLAEDQDLSFRAFARGWTSRNIVLVAADGELPESLDVLAIQRTRWSAGTAQAFHGLPWQLLRFLTWPQAVLFALLVQFHASIALLLGATLGLTLLSLLLDPYNGRMLAVGLAAAVVWLVVAKTTGCALATRAIGRKLDSTFVGDVIRMWLMEATLLPIVARALILGYFSRRLTFRRTPKQGL